MKNVVRNITGISDKRRALFVKSVDVKNIIGYKINGSFNVAQKRHSRQFKKKAGLKTRFYRYKDKIHFDNFRTIVK
jgi:hypothetical protein